MRSLDILLEDWRTFKEKVLDRSSYYQDEFDEFESQFLYGLSEIVSEAYSEVRNQYEC